MIIKHHSMTATPGAARARVYTEQDMVSMLEGYICLAPSMWDHIPTGSHLRYVKRNEPGANATRAERFRPGSYLRNHFTRDGKKMMLLETILNGASNTACKTFPVAYESVDELWKKYDKNSFIEIHLIRVSLTDKQRHIEQLEAETRALRADVDGLKSILARMVRS